MKVRCSYSNRSYTPQCSSSKAPSAFPYSYSSLQKPQRYCVIRALRSWSEEFICVQMSIVCDCCLWICITLDCTRSIVFFSKICILWSEGYGFKPHHPSVLHLWSRWFIPNCFTLPICNWEAIRASHYILQLCTIYVCSEMSHWQRNKLLMHFDQIWRGDMNTNIDFIYPKQSWNVMHICNWQLHIISQKYDRGVELYWQ